jgi:hypothetical protein
MTIELKPEEVELIRRIVRQYYMNLRAEIYHTDATLFKKRLKDEEGAVMGLLEKIGVSFLDEPVQ